MVLILDESASTGYRQNTESVHDVILERARTLLSELDGTRGDRVRLLSAALASRSLSAHAPDDALAALSTLGAPRDEPLDLAQALADVVEMAEADAGSSGRSSLEIRLLTDLQRNSFTHVPAPTGKDAEATSGAGPGALQQALDRLEKVGAVVVVEDLGPGMAQPPNLGVEEVAPLGELLGAGMPVEIGVTVRNFGAAGRSGVRVALVVDGTRQPSQKLDIAARSGAQAVFSVVFSEPGYHALTAELEGDRLAVDDTRSTVVYVPAPLRVLLVDGAPHDEIDRDEVGYLRAALEPPDDSLVVHSPSGPYSPFVCEVVPANAFGGPEGDPAAHDIVVVCNVASLSAEIVARLETWVARGGALIFTLGDRSADPSALDSLNARLWKADESGLLPARLERHVAVASRQGPYFRPASFDETHPALRFFADERWRSMLTEVPVYEFVAAQPLSNARVLVSLDDEAKSPLLVERTYDRGRVYLWTTSIDDDWTLLPRLPATLIPLAHELLRDAGTGVLPQRTVEVGGRLEVEVDSFPRQALLVEPDGSRRPLDGEPEEVADGLWRLPSFGSLDAAGPWRIECEAARPVLMASQLVVAEGDLERLTPEELESSHAAWRFHAGVDQETDREPEADRGELWRWFAGTTLAFLVLETLWAAWLGRGRGRT
jgi:hypothetical protein